MVKAMAPNEMIAHGVFLFLERSCKSYRFAVSMISMNKSGVAYFCKNRCRVQVTSAFYFSEVGKSSTSCNVERIRLCWVAGNCVIP